MGFITEIALILLLPIQFYSWGVLNKETVPGWNNLISGHSSKVEGAAIEKEKEEKKEEEKNQSLRGSISEASSKRENFSESGFMPQRKKSFRPIKIFAGSSVVLDADSGTILHYDEGRSRMAIASLTKMMTAVLVMEKIDDLDEPVTVDQEALRADGTKVGCPTSVSCVNEMLHPGEKVTAKDLLTAMLLDSANDAAVALGKHIAGSQQAFGELMNEKARELNLSDSQFCNPSGLDEDNCYSSAYDLARIVAYSMKYDTIWKIMKTQETSINSCDGKYTHLLRNTDVLLDQIPNCLGGKTGFTYNAGKSLMLAAADPVFGKHKIIAVILNDNNRWEDMRTLVDWTFTNYEWR